MFSQSTNENKTGLKPVSRILKHGAIVEMGGWLKGQTTGWKGGDK